MAENKNHFNHPIVGIVVGSLATIWGLLLIVGPNSAYVGGSGGPAAAFPNWVVGAIMVALGIPFAILGLRQALKRK